MAADSGLILCQKNFQNFLTVILPKFSPTFIHIHYLGYHEQEYCYPYHAHDQECNYSGTCIYGAGIVTNQVYAWGTNEEELKTMVVEYGPVVTGLDASGLQFYNSGVMDSLVCCNAMNNDHCV